MKNIYRIKEIPEFKIEYYSNMVEINSPELHKLLSDSFSHSYLINDIDIQELNSDDYLKHLSNKEGCIIYFKNKPICFSLFDYRHDLDSMSIIFYSPSYINKRYVKNSLICSIVFFFFYKKNNFYKSIYFDQALNSLYKIVKKLIPIINRYIIRENYSVCYSPISKNYIENIILKDYTVELC